MFYKSRGFGGVRLWLGDYYYSNSRAAREEFFSETGLPANLILGNSAGMKRGPKWLCSGLIPSLFIISQARRNVVVAPGRIIAINGFVLPMLLLLLLGVVLPRVDAFVRHPSFLLLDVVDDGSKVCATPTGAYGTSGS